MYAARYFPKRYFAGRYFPPVTGAPFEGWTETTTGGLTFSGLSAVENLYVEPIAGGILLGGAAAREDTYVEATDGGILLGGSAVVQWRPAGAAGLARRLWYRLGVGF